MATTNTNFKVKNGLDAGSDISTTGIFKSNASAGDEGGQIDLAKAVTNTTLTTGISIDVYQNKLRFFETGGTNRGFYIDMTTGGASVGTNLVGGGSSFTGGTLTSNLTLAAGTTSLSPLTFQSGTNLTTVTAGAREYDGTVFYQTSNTTPGRAVDLQSYYYVTTSTGLDFSAATTAQTMLQDGTGTANTRGITLVSGTTYEFDMVFNVQYQSFGDSTTPLSFGWTRTTVSGTPTTTIQSIIDYGNNTTSFATATTLSTINGSATTTVSFTSPGASGSRYITYRGKGIIRVTGTSASVKIYPSIASGAGTTVNVPTVQTNGYFKLTPIGNGTVTSVGAFA